MLYPGQKSRIVSLPGTHYLLPPQVRREDLETFPTVLSGSQLTKHFPHHGFPEKAVQPCSLDVVIESFSSPKGKVLKLPFTLPYGEVVLAHSRLKYDAQPEDGEVTLCVETRSRNAARFGLTCMGFYKGQITTPFVTENADLSFAIKNYAPFPAVIEEGWSPVQLLGIKLSHHPYTEQKLRVKLSKDDTEVTEDCKADIGGFTCYVVGIDGEMKYFQTTTKPMTLEEAESNILTASIDGIEQIKPDFCLTTTRERVVTNGCPVYMLPFHCRDILDNIILYTDKEAWAKFFTMTFSDKRFMPTTTNAGLHNPGCTGQIVCENITKGRDLKKYFGKGQPFGIIIPLPFADGSLDDSSYRTERHQEGVKLR